MRLEDKKDVNEFDSAKHETSYKTLVAKTLVHTVMDCQPERNTDSTL